MFICQAFQMVMVPLAHDYAAALTAGASGTLSTLLVTAKTLYTMTDIGDAFVSLVLFDGILISWALIALKKPHPRYFVWWMLLLAVLPLGRLIGYPILGLANAVLTGFLFLVMGFFMLRFAPLEKKQFSLKG
jgi:hypothetical protein